MSYSNTSTGGKSADPYKDANKDSPSLREKIEGLVSFIKSSKFGMMTTRTKESGLLSSRCMAVAAQVNTFPFPFHPPSSLLPPKKKNSNSSTFYQTLRETWPEKRGDREHGPPPKKIGKRWRKPSLLHKHRIRQNQRHRIRPTHQHFLPQLLGRMGLCIGGSDNHHRQGRGEKVLFPCAQGLGGRSRGWET